MPVDARITDELDVPTEGLALDRLLAGLGERGDEATNLIILDACRNNPYKWSDQRAIGERGLARVSAPSGTLILYATRPGETASDNPQGRNGLFTKHLLAAMDEEGIEVETAFKEVARQVYAESRKHQSPWQEGVIFGRFCFRLAPAAGYQAVPSPPPPAPLGHLQINTSVPARVDMDGRSAGQAAPGRPLNLSDLPVGEHAITVTAAGYRAVRERHQVRVGEWTQVTVVLHPERPEPVEPPTAGGRAGWPSTTRYAERPSYDASSSPNPADVEVDLGLDWQQRAGIQRMLNALGHDAGMVDGIFGAQTRDAIRSYQRGIGVLQTGYLDLEQLEHLLETGVDLAGDMPGEMIQVPPAEGTAMPFFFASAFCSMTGARGDGLAQDSWEAISEAVENCISNGGMPKCCELGAQLIEIPGFAAVSDCIASGAKGAAVGQPTPRHALGAAIAACVGDGGLESCCQSGTRLIQIATPGFGEEMGWYTEEIIIEDTPAW